MNRKRNKKENKVRFVDVLAQSEWPTYVEHVITWTAQRPLLKSIAFHCPYDRIEMTKICLCPNQITFDQSFSPILVLLRISRYNGKSISIQDFESLFYKGKQAIIPALDNGASLAWYAWHFGPISKLSSCPHKIIASNWWLSIRRIKIGTGKWLDVDQTRA